MAEMTIRLRINAQTGKKDIVVSLRSDEDAMPHEHEQQHKQLVEKLIEGGVISAAEAGVLIVEREEADIVSDGPIKTPEKEQRQSHSEGN